MKVHSDEKRKPRYYVTDEKKKIIFESEDGTETIQWAIDHMDTNILQLAEGVFEVKEMPKIPQGFIVQGAKWRKRRFEI